MPVPVVLPLVPTAATMVDPVAAALAALAALSDGSIRPSAIAGTASATTRPTPARAVSILRIQDLLPPASSPGGLAC